MGNRSLILALSLSREQWIAVIAIFVAVSVILGLMGALRWMKTHCTLCNKLWKRTGNNEDAGHMAGRNAIKEEWKCPSCGHTEWIKTTSFGF